MSPENQEKLYKKFPQLYRSNQSPLGDFGIECNDGWFQLLYSLSGKIDTIFRSSKLSEENYPEVVQVKEKFGGLRFYVENIHPSIRDEINRVIDIFENHSVETCELCGRNGSLRNDRRWIKTLCEEHNKPIESRELAGNIA